METTAKQICDWALEAMHDLSTRKEFGNITAVYGSLARISGLSESWIAKFYQRALPNPTRKTIDVLVAAIKVCQQKASA